MFGAGPEVCQPGAGITCSKLHATHNNIPAQFASHELGPHDHTADDWYPCNIASFALHLNTALLR